MDILKLDLNGSETKAPDADEIRFQIALLAGLAGTGVSFLIRFLLDAPFLPELLAQSIFAILPINLIAFVVGFLGPFAKHLAFLGCLVLYTATLTGIAYSLLKWSLIQKHLHVAAKGKRVLFYSLYLFVIWLLILSVVLPILGGGFFGSYLRQGSFYTSLSLLLVLSICLLTILLFENLFSEKPKIAQINTQRFSRRRLMRSIGYAVLAVGVYDIAKSLASTWFQFNSGRVSNGDGIFPNLDGLALEITPVSITQRKWNALSLA